MPPEMQIVSESSVAGYANFIQTTIEAGVGRAASGQRDVQADYSAQMALADSAEKLVAALDLLLTGQRLSSASRTRIVDAVAAISVAANDAARAETARRNRVRLATLLIMVSPDYLVQK